jgi:hypothetical protein
VKKVIVRFDRSGNRSNDSAERTIGFCALSEVVRNAGGEGLSSSLRSRSEGSRVIVRSNRSVVFTERMFYR